MLNLKNKSEREEFVRNYKSWGEWTVTAGLGMRHYRYRFANGAVLIVTEWQEYAKKFNDGGSYSLKHYSLELVTRNRCCLILPENDTYADNSHTSGEVYHRTYTPDGCSIGTVVDYMTKNKDVI
jgi:hypothetical protein